MQKVWRDQRCRSADDSRHVVWTPDVGVHRAPTISYYFGPVRLKSRQTPYGTGALRDLLMVPGILIPRPRSCSAEPGLHWWLDKTSARISRSGRNEVHTEDRKISHKERRQLPVLPPQAACHGIKDLQAGRILGRGPCYGRTGDAQKEPRPQGLEYAGRACSRSCDGMPPHNNGASWRYASRAARNVRHQLSEPEGREVFSVLISVATHLPQAPARCSGGADQGSEHIQAP